MTEVSLTDTPLPDSDPAPDGEVKPLRLFLIAGENSGDMHAANMMRALRRRHPDVRATGLGGPQMEAAGVKLNLPMRAGSNDEDFDRAWGRVVEHLRAHKPEFIILQCGADSIAGDPLTGMEYTPVSFTRAARDLAAIARVFSGGRLLALGGGGYNLSNIAAGWNNVVQGLVEA